MKKRILSCIIGTVIMIAYAAFRFDTLNSFLTAAIGWSLCLDIIILYIIHSIDKKPIEEENISIENDSRKISYHKIFKVAGVTFPCMLDSETNRQEILEDCSESFTYYLQEYRYKGKLAYLVVCKELGADIGTVPKEFVNTIVKYVKYENRDTAIQCNKIDYFEPDSGSENKSNGKTIYYAKMQFIVYAK